MVEDASGDVAAEDARDVNTQLQVEMIKQQRKTNVLLRARTQTVSASLAPARTRTRLVQQQHHALRWQPSEERDPADHRAQPGKVKYAETGSLATPSPYEVRPPGLELALEPVLVPVQPREPAQTRLHAAPAAGPRQARNHRGLSKLNVWVAHMRIALSSNNSNT